VLLFLSPRPRQAVAWIDASLRARSWWRGSDSNWGHHGFQSTLTLADGFLGGDHRLCYRRLLRLEPVVDSFLHLGEQVGQVIVQRVWLRLIRRERAV